MTFPCAFVNGCSRKNFLMRASAHASHCSDIPYTFVDHARRLLLRTHPLLPFKFGLQPIRFPARVFYYSARFVIHCSTMRYPTSRLLILKSVDSIDSTSASQRLLSLELSVLNLGAAAARISRIATTAFMACHGTRLCRRSFSSRSCRSWRARAVASCARIRNEIGLIMEAA